MAAQRLPERVVPSKARKVEMGRFPVSAAGVPKKKAPEGWRFGNRALCGTTKIRAKDSTQGSSLVVSDSYSFAGQTGDAMAVLKAESNFDVLKAPLFNKVKRAVDHSEV
jgi:hypothetical protein